MDNQHRKIKGYRELSQEEIDLVNEIKDLGPECRAMVDKIVFKASLSQEDTDPEEFREAMRWAAIARTHFQEGLMALTRAVTRPEFF